MGTRTRSRNAASNPVQSRFFAPRRPNGTRSCSWVRWPIRCCGCLSRHTSSAPVLHFAYSVLTHEEIVDLVWTDELRPLLLQRFPALTEAQITEAHAYAYGGAVIQDLGYYPFGSMEFSNLVHYVRSGDFVRELLLESQDANEYAFALGALAHYTSDIVGHPTVNQAVAIEYPKASGKVWQFGQIRTGSYRALENGIWVRHGASRKKSLRVPAVPRSHRVSGFQTIVGTCFPVVYGVELKDVLAHEDLAIGSYRYSVSQLIPKMTQVALRTHKKDIMRETPGFARRKFLYRLSRSDYEKEWGKDYTKADFGTRFWALHSCISCPKSAHSRPWRSTIQPRKRRKCISRASIRPSISIACYLQQVRARVTPAAKLRFRYGQTD